VDTTCDARFDPNFALQLLLDIAHEQSLEQLLQKLVRHAVERPFMSCVQIWLIDRGDRCAVCPHRARCPDQRRCLHLVAGRGVPRGGGGAESNPFGDPNARIPLGVGFVGQAAVSGEQIVLRDLVSRSEECVGLDWLEREQIRACGATPIIHRGEVLGAIVGFTRTLPSEEGRPWGRVFADHIGAAIANARAFEEIQRLKAQLELQNAYLQEEVVEAKAFGELIGQSAALRQIVTQIDLVAPTDASVVILGETGTGKELVAREIHRRSRRANGPLVRVNCASIPKDLFESEFFGHVKGAFTGAVKDRTGRFEAAEGGTLFLDEVGEVPVDMQSKLLRVLQEKRYERVGDDRTRPADVRIMAATNRDLKKALGAGRFREDLYYRLHVFPIQVPPLRERMDDIPLLARHFIEVSTLDMKCTKPRLTRAGVARLMSYDWPGNVRELRNVIERAVILARGGTLEFDLPVATALPHSARGGLRTDTVGKREASPAFLTEIELERLERENLLVILEKTQWRIKGPEGAAELLGVKPTTLMSRIKKWGLRPSATSGLARVLGDTRAGHLGAG
jgi:transcriptional regulator with GAF, ATPase, and Fis domain